MKPRVNRRSPFANVLLASALAGMAGVSNANARIVSPATRRTIPQIQKLMGELSARAAAINPMGKGAEVVAFCASVCEQINTESWLKDRMEVTLAASKGDREAVEMMAEIVSYTTTNLILANANWLSFFEQESLGDSDTPMIQSDIGQQIIVDAIGPDGGNISVQAQFERDQYPVPLFTLASQWFEYPLTDLYKGSQVKDAALANIDIALDFADKLNALLGSYLTIGGTNSRLVDNFTTTGANLGRDYVARAAVNTANFPTGNHVVLSGNTTTSPFRKEVFDAVEQYVGKWGSGVFSDGDIAPVAIHIASAHAADFLGQVTLGSYANPVTEQIFNGGRIMSYAGRNWIIIPDNTIDPNLGTAYIRTNKPIGYFFDKPSQSRTINDPDASLALQNKGRIAETRVVGFGMPKHWRRNVLGVTYKTAV